MPEDIFLIEQVLTGNNDAYDNLMDRYEKAVFNLAYRIIGNYEDAADATQEAFIRAYRSLSTFRHDAKFSTWVCRIVTNICYDMLRKKKRQNIVSLHNDFDEDDNSEMDIPDPDITTNPLERVTRDELRSAIVEAIYSLDSSQRDVMVLRDIQGYSYKEISDLLSLAEGTVKSRLNRARLKVIKLLQDHGELLPYNLRQNE